jgi:1,2-diacylglycerol 3-alpha-glucosyltransferase
MRNRLVILTEIISPYRIPLFNALAENSDVDLHVVFLAETDPRLRKWKVYRNEIRFSHQVLPSYRSRIRGYNVLLNSGISRALSKAAPSAILCGGYNYVASWRALLWARMHGVPFILWTESNQQDLRRGYPIVELIKKNFLLQCSGFVVPGISAREFLRAHKLEESKIFTAVNAVDNDLFVNAACGARKQAAQLRARFDLPDRYFLFSGRLVRNKGIFDLLAAYTRLDNKIRDHIGLVFVGDGPSRPALELEAASLTRGVVKLAGFAHREELPIYYALAEALILPTYSDPWGLVVNEAMACGLPIIVSEAAGCVRDLVTEEWNGQVVGPRDVSSLAASMHKLARNPDLRMEMGRNSTIRIAAYSPRKWSDGIRHMLQVVTATHE